MMPLLWKIGDGVDDILDLEFRVRVILCGIKRGRSVKQQISNYCIFSISIIFLVLSFYFCNRFLCAEAVIEPCSATFECFLVLYLKTQGLFKDTCLTWFADKPQLFQATQTEKKNEGTSDQEAHRSSKHTVCTCNMTLKGNYIFTPYLKNTSWTLLHFNISFLYSIVKSFLH